MTLFTDYTTQSYEDYMGSFPTVVVEKIQEYIDWLGDYQGANVYNPWRDVDLSLDASDDAPHIRKRNLMAYLLPRLGRAKIFVVAEAVGYQGGRFSGIAITCERMILGHHKTIKPSDVANIDLERTSSPVALALKPIQRQQGMNEPTDTVVWNAIIENNIAPYDTLLWNIFPFHPHKLGEPLTNRTPTLDEQKWGWEYTKRLLTLHEELRQYYAVNESKVDHNTLEANRNKVEIASYTLDTNNDKVEVVSHILDQRCGQINPLILAVGQKSADTMKRFGLEAIGLRHPANGGANLYRDGFGKAVKEYVKDR